MPSRSSIVAILLLLSASAPASAAFIAAGAVPEGDYDLEMNVEIGRRTLRGCFCVERAGDESLVEIRFDGDACRLARGAEAEGLRPEGAALERGEHVLVVRKRAGPGAGASYALDVDGRVVDELYVARRAAGKLACGTVDLAGVRITRLKAPRVGEAFFADTFDREEGVPPLGEWSARSGKWDIVTTRDAWVAVDEGPFATSSLRARPDGMGRAVVVADPRRLARVHCAVAVRIPSGCAAGIAVVADGAMRLVEIAPGAKGRGRARVAFRDGDEDRELSPKAEARVRADAWTLLELWSDWRRVRVAVGGAVVLDAAADRACAGRVSLFASGDGEVLFDDVSVRPWRVVRGTRTWRRVSQGAVAARMRFESDAWPREGFRLEVSAAAGARVRSAPAVVLPGTLTDASSELAEAIAEARVRGCRSLAVDVAGPHAILLVDGERSRTVADVRFVGSAPCVARAGRDVGDEIVLEESRRDREALAFESTFPSPYIATDNNKGKIRIVRGIFSPNSGSWSVRRTGAGGGRLVANAAKLGVLKYARPMPGDVRVAIELVDVDRKSFARAGIIASAGRNERGVFTGYSLGVEVAGDDAPEATLGLRRCGKRVAFASLPNVGDALTLALERRGDALFCYAGERIVISWRDPEPLSWEMAGLFVSRGRASFDRFSIEHLDGTYADFRNVEPDWQPVAGTWKLHTGLTCIAWDHWITAFGEKDAPAYLCHERMRLRDVVTVARVSEASEGFETRTHVHHPLHDIAISLRARADAPRASGYRIVLAPLPSKDTVVVYRAGVEVARAKTFRIVMGGHNNSPRAFTVVARAVDGLVTCDVNGRQVVAWQDPNPLPAGHVMLGAEKGRVNFADVSVMAVPATGADEPVRLISDK